MSFNVSADAYARFMGQYSEPLAMQFADAALVKRGQRALDVGCGPGALSAVLVERLGADNVVGIDPSDTFVAAYRGRFPGVEVHAGGAEQMPFADDRFDTSLAQLVVSFMTDPVAGLTEMARVTRRGGTIAACVWDLAGDSGPLSTFWRAARDLDPEAVDESERPGAREGHLVELFEQAGLRDLVPSTITATVQFATFADWWEPYTLGVGPAGAYVAQLDDSRRDRLRARCAELLPAAPFEVNASAWCVHGRV